MSSRSGTARARTFGVRFRGDPLTYRKLAEAAVALGADPDLVLEDPRGTFDALEPTLPQYHEFTRLVLEPAPFWYWRRRGIAYDPEPWYLFWRRRKPDLLRMPAAPALALGRELAADFWSAAWLESVTTRPDKFARYMIGGEFRQTENRARVLDSFDHSRAEASPST